MTAASPGTEGTYPDQGQEHLACPSGQEQQQQAVTFLIRHPEIVIQAAVEASVCLELVHELEPVLNNVVMQLDFDIMLEESASFLVHLLRWVAHLVDLLAPHPAFAFASVLVAAVAAS